MTKWDDSPRYRVPAKVLGVWETCASKSDEQVFKSVRSVVCKNMPLSLLWCLCVGGEGQILLPWMRSSWTKPCWTLRFLSMQTANCSLWGSLLPLKVHKQTHTHKTHLFVFFKSLLRTLYWQWLPFWKSSFFYAVLFVSFPLFHLCKPLCVWPLHLH